MRVRSLILTGVLVVILLAGTGGVYAYDSGHKGRIAEGISVNDVPVGGMDAAQARARLRATLLAPLNRPVRVSYQGRRFTLTPRQAAVGVDIDGSVNRALARSQQGSMFTRTWREVRGQKIPADLDAKITWSQPAIERLVAKVDRALARPAADAKLDLARGSVNPTPSHAGLSVRTARLGRDIERALLDSTGSRRVKVRTDVLRPKVSTAQLASQYPAIIIVNRGAFRLTLYKDLKPVKTYGIAVGRAGLETPAGLYHIQDKQVDPAWHVPDSAWAGKLAGKVIPPGDPANPIKARWMGIYNGAGIHGTSEDDSIGSAASHGCIRMHIPDVEQLFDQVSVGAPVYIS
ncbi:MAG: L,D-transpeptidase ErfK/SrfK [Solirubrobacteraceae bacterium]|nr:L,D-transpeptidase ErfK/SrfK [Solirubrobacteraceae bacterium]